jgi:hypothetical protein
MQSVAGKPLAILLSHRAIGEVAPAIAGCPSGPGGWSMPTVIVTAHSAGYAAGNAERVAQCFVDKRALGRRRAAPQCARVAPRGLGDRRSVPGGALRDRRRDATWRACPAGIIGSPCCPPPQRPS